MSQGPEVNRASIRKYWEKPETVSIIDKNLHKIEMDIAASYLMKTDFVADIGCGDGEATAFYAEHAKKCVGIEQSNHLRSQAEARSKTARLTNLTFKPGDVLNQVSILDPEEKYDVVITQRMLINLISWEDQRKGIVNIFNALKPGGRFVMIENTVDSFQAMNEMRADVGLQPVPQHWHNRFFDYDKLESFMDGKFQLLNTHDLGLYYFLTRVYTPMFASFVGYGAQAVKDPVFEHADKAALEIYEKFHDQIKIGNHRVFGPIQVLVYRRELES